MRFECTAENAAAVAARIRGEVGGIAVVQVTAIVEDVAERGDEALLEYEEQFSGNDRIVVTRDELDEALAGLDGAVRAGLEIAIANVRAVAEAGAFALVVEGVVEPIAAAITREVACPTIGIGASAECDGQVLVAEDMLGLFERTPRFVKRYDDMAGRISAAAELYAAEVRSRAFPGAEQVYSPKP